MDAVTNRVGLALGLCAGLFTAVVLLDYFVPVPVAPNRLFVMLSLSRLLIMILFGLTAVRWNRRELWRLTAASKSVTAAPRLAGAPLVTRRVGWLVLCFGPVLLFDWLAAWSFWLATSSVSRVSTWGSLEMIMSVFVLAWGAGAAFLRFLMIRDKTGRRNRVWLAVAYWLLLALVGYVTIVSWAGGPHQFKLVGHLQLRWLTLTGYVIVVFGIVSTALIAHSDRQYAKPIWPIWTLLVLVLLPLVVHTPIGQPVAAWLSPIAFGSTLALPALWLLTLAALVWRNWYLMVASFFTSTYVSVAIFVTALMAILD